MNQMDTVIPSWILQYSGDNAQICNKPIGGQCSRCSSDHMSNPSSLSLHITVTQFPFGNRYQVSWPQCLGKPKTARGMLSNLMQLNCLTSWRQPFLREQDFQFTKTKAVEIGNRNSRLVDLTVRRVTYNSTPWFPDCILWLWGNDTTITDVKYILLSVGQQQSIRES